MAAPQQCCLLLQTPEPLKALVRIRLQLQEQAAPDQDDSSMQAPALPGGRVGALCKRLNQQQPGGALVAVPAEPDGCVVVCLKATVAKVFKALHSQQAALGIQPPDVKRSILLGPMDPEELAAPLAQACLLRLRQLGWAPLGEGRLLGCNYAQTPPGQLRECACLDGVRMRAEPPDRLFLVLEPSAVRFRALGTAGLKGGAPPEAPASSRAAATVDRIPCCLLPGLRLAWATEALPAPARDCGVLPAAAELCRELLGRSRAGGAACLRVTASPDDDEPSAAWPACCVWAASGLNALPARKCDTAAVLSRLAGELQQAGWSFWGSKPPVVMSQGICRFQPTAAAHASLEWGSASQLPQHAQQAAGATACLSQSSVVEPCPPAASAGCLAEEQTAALRAALQKLQAADAGQPGAAARRLGGPGRGSAAQAPAAHGRAPGPGDAGKAKAPVLLARKRVTFGAAAVAANATPKALQAALAKAAPAKPKKAAKPAKAQASPVPKPSIAGSAGKAAGGSQKAAAAQAGAQPASQLPAIAEEPAGQAAPQQATQPAAGKPAVQAKRKAAAGPAGDSKTGKTQTNAQAAAEGEAKPARKRTKAEDLDSAAVESKAKQLLAAGQLAKLTLPEMKCLLKARGQPLGGKKADLVARVAACLG